MSDVIFPQHIANKLSCLASIVDSINVLQNPINQVADVFIWKKKKAIKYLYRKWFQTVWEQNPSEIDVTLLSQIHRISNWLVWLLVVSHAKKKEQLNVSYLPMNALGMVIFSQRRSRISKPLSGFFIAFVITLYGMFTLRRVGFMVKTSESVSRFSHDRRACVCASHAPGSIGRTGSERGIVK